MHPRTRLDEPSDTMTSNEKIRLSHEIRNRALKAIRDADMDSGKELIEHLMLWLNHPELGIMNRVDGEKGSFRSLKNIILSYNTLFSYMAELGGLSPIVAHYKAEKYAIMIEHAQTENEVVKLYFDYSYDYLDKNSRLTITKTDPISQQVLEYISRNFTSDISIDAIANELHLNPAYLMRRFKKETGNTIQKTITNRRIQEACQLLANSNMTLTEISMIVGFQSSSYFSHVFRQIMSISPKAYRVQTKTH